MSSFRSAVTTSTRGSLALSLIQDRCPELKLSKITTRSVCLSSKSKLTRWLPIKPAPPETKTRFHSGEKLDGTSDNAGAPGSVNLGRAGLI